MNQTRILLATAVSISLWALGCGTKQPAQEIKPPEPVILKAGTCPGALPGMNIQVTGAIGESNAPVIEWVGGAFAVAWWDLRGQFPQVRMLRIDREGVNRSPAVKIANKAAAKDQSLSWDGKELHLVFMDGKRVMSARLGTADEEPRPMTESGDMPSAGPWGAAVWVDAGKLMFINDGMTNLFPDGRVQEQPKPTVIAGGGIEDPQIAFNGKFFAVTWSSSMSGGREILLQRVSPKGRKLGSPVHVSATAGISRKPVMKMSGSDFAIAWTNAAPADQNPSDRYRIFFAVVPETGDTPKMTRQLAFQGSADQVALAATGREFGLAWVGSRKPMGSAVYFQRLGLDGSPLEDTVEVTDGVPLACGRPSLAWDGEGYGIAWHDDRSQTGSEVFFSYVECGEEASVEPSEPAAAEVEPDAGAASGSAEPASALPALKDAFGDKDSTVKKAGKDAGKKGGKSKKKSENN